MGTIIYIRKQSQTRPVCSGEIQKEPFLLPVTYSLEKEREKKKKKKKSDEVAHDKITRLTMFTKHQNTVLQFTQIMQYRTI